jgi:hypothetical protein
VTYALGFRVQDGRKFWKAYLIAPAITVAIVLLLSLFPIHPMLRVTIAILPGAWYLYTVGVLRNQPPEAKPGDELG